MTGDPTLEFGAQVENLESFRFRLSLAKALRGFDKKLRTPFSLHHYTGPRAFKGIIETGTLWASHIAYMNDRREYLHAIDLMKEVVDTRLQKTKKPQLQKMLKLLEARLLAVNVESIPSVFVTCFSRHDDDLSQWRGYGRGEGGICLTFNTIMLERIAGSQSAYLFPVVYLKDEQLSICRKILQIGCVEYEKAAKVRQVSERADHMTNWVQRFIDEFSFVAPTLKDPAFRREGEWRLIIHENDPHKVEIEATEIGLKGHVVIKLREDDPEAPDQPDWPLREVRIGPAPNGALTRLAVRALLTKSPFGEVPVEFSNVPFRGAV